MKDLFLLLYSQSAKLSTQPSVCKRKKAGKSENNTPAEAGVLLVLFLCSRQAAGQILYLLIRLMAWTNAWMMEMNQPITGLFFMLSFRSHMLQRNSPVGLPPMEPEALPP